MIKEELGRILLSSPDIIEDLKGRKILCINEVTGEHRTMYPWKLPELTELRPYPVDAKLAFLDNALKMGMEGYTVVSFCKDGRVLLGVFDHNSLDILLDTSRYLQAYSKGLLKDGIPNNKMFVIRPDRVSLEPRKDIWEEYKDILKSDLPTTANVIFTNNTDIWYATF